MTFEKRRTQSRSRNRSDSHWAQDRMDYSPRDRCRSRSRSRARSSAWSGAPSRSRHSSASRRREDRQGYIPRGFPIFRPSNFGQLQEHMKNPFDDDNRSRGRSRSRSRQRSGTRQQQDHTKDPWGNDNRSRGRSRSRQRSGSRQQWDHAKDPWGNDNRPRERSRSRQRSGSRQQKDGAKDPWGGDNRPRERSRSKQRSGSQRKDWTKDLWGNDNRSRERSLSRRSSGSRQQQVWTKDPWGIDNRSRERSRSRQPSGSRQQKDQTKDLWGNDNRSRERSFSRRSSNLFLAPRTVQMVFLDSSTTGKQNISPDDGASVTQSAHQGRNHNASGMLERPQDSSTICLEPPSYYYIPLRTPESQIRLLRVWKTTELYGEVRVVDQHLLKQDYPYWALSYTWGDPERECQREQEEQPKKTHRICLRNTTASNDNAKEQRHLFITKSLHDLLVHMTERKEYKWYQWLWTDAICIRQSGDVREKTCQLRKMKQIYSNAETVYAWLGPGTPDTDLGMKFILEQPQESKNSIDEDMSKDRSSAVRMDRFTKELRNHHFDLKAIFKRAYWTRMWILQELAVAKDSAIIACGTYEINWLDFVEFAMAADVVKEVTQDLGLPRHIWMLNYMHWHHPQDLTLSRVIYLAQKAHCREIADTVHAILGLVRSGRGTKLQFESDSGPQTMFCAAINAIMADLRNDARSQPSRYHHTLQCCEQLATEFEGGKRPTNWDDDDFIGNNCRDPQDALNLCRTIASRCHEVPCVYPYVSRSGFSYECSPMGVTLVSGRHNIGLGSRRYVNATDEWY